MKTSPTTLLSPAGRQTLDAFLERHVSNPAQFSTEISPEDEMYLYQLVLSAGNNDESILRYFDSGRLMLSEYKPIVEGIFGSFDNVDSLLEFACGHGRFTRYLLQEMEPERLFASDIYTDAVEFQRKQFGIRGVPSVTNPDDFVSHQSHQLILVSSLFSHLPAETFSRWLGRLYQLLSDDGVLVFTVHDADVLPSELSVGADGIYFRPESESRSLKKSEYGTTFVDEGFVSRAIAETCPGAGEYVRIKQGLWRYQDVYVVSRGGNRDISKAGLNRGPRGYIDRFLVQESGASLMMKGWAHDFESGREAERVEIYAGNALIGTCQPNTPRPDVVSHFGESAMAHCGWECQVDARGVRDNDVISIEAFGQSGQKFVLECDTLLALSARVGTTPL